MELNILLSRWLSRCILRVTKEKNKEKFRQLEKYKVKNLKAKSHLFFNETCLNNNLLPVYTKRIYIYIYKFVIIYETGKWFRFVHIFIIFDS